MYTLYIDENIVKGLINQGNNTIDSIEKALNWWDASPNLIKILVEAAVIPSNKKSHNVYSINSRLLRYYLFELENKNQIKDVL